MKLILRRTTAGAVLVSLELVPLMMSDESELTSLGSRFHEALRPRTGSLSSGGLPRISSYRRGSIRPKKFKAASSTSLQPDSSTPQKVDVVLEVDDTGHAPSLETLKLLPPPDRPMPELQPERRWMTVNIGVLGIRNLRRSVKTRKILRETLYCESPQRPFVEFDVGRGGLGNRLRARVHQRALAAASSILSAAQGRVVSSLSAAQGGVMSGLSAAQGGVMARINDLETKVSDKPKFNPPTKRIQGTYAVVHTKATNRPSATSPCALLTS